jgi:ankyrin repeat protein
LELEAVRRLIRAGADVNQERKGWTPLLHAVDIECDAAVQRGVSSEEMTADLIELLLASGASPTVKALEMAQRYENHRAVAVLRAHGVRA